MKMFIMRGLPGSGKSSLAGSLCQEYLDAIVVSADNYFMVGGKYFFDPAMLGIAHKTCLWRAKQAVNNRWPVIVDNTNTTWKEIKDYAKLAIDVNYQIEVHEPQTEWAFKTHICFKKNTHGVPLETIQKMRDRWEDTESIEYKIALLRNKNGS